MKRTIVLAVILAALLAAVGCGTTIIEKTVTETVTATPSPSPTPAVMLSASDEEGLAAIKMFLVDLKHIYRTISNTVDYGIRTGNTTGILARAEHYSDDWKALNRAYSRSNGGENYGGKVTKLENLFVDAGDHVRKFGVGTIRVMVESGDGAATSAAKNSAWAQQGIGAVEREIERLGALASGSY
jgi:hypothetical protein